MLALTRFAFPDFLPQTVVQWRHPIREKLERADMLKRRLQIEIPEFYVGRLTLGRRFWLHSYVYVTQVRYWP